VDNGEVVHEIIDRPVAAGIEFMDMEGSAVKAVIECAVVFMIMAVKNDNWLLSLVQIRHQFFSACRINDDRNIVLNKKRMRKRIAALVLGLM
jgi:hypothetical protein